MAQGVSARSWSNQGLRVIRYDNRDVGLSTKVPGAHSGAPLLPRHGALVSWACKSPAVYTLEDMADDAAALLDHLGIDPAHVVGGSMGGMIAQVFAARPRRTAPRSLGVIFSRNNQALLPPPGPRQLLATVAEACRTPRATAIIANSIRVSRIIGSPGYLAAEDQVARRRARELRAVLLPGRGRPAVRRHPGQRQPAAPTTGRSPPRRWSSTARRTS